MCAANLMLSIKRVLRDLRLVHSLPNNRILPREGDLTPPGVAPAGAMGYSPMLPPTKKDRTAAGHKRDKKTSTSQAHSPVPPGMSVLSTKGVQYCGNPKGDYAVAASYISAK